MAKKLSLGEKIDTVYRLRAERIDLQRQYEEEIDALKKDEKALKEQIIAELRKQKLDKGSGAACTATITQAIYPRVTDWDRVYKWVKQTGAFEIFERRISKATFKERYEAGEGIPGIDAFEDEDLSLTKR